MGHAWAGIRRAGVSAFGFGGTNFHAVLEEHVPGRHRGDQAKPVSFAGVDVPQTPTTAPDRGTPSGTPPPMPSGEERSWRARPTTSRSRLGYARLPTPPMVARPRLRAHPTRTNLHTPVRVAIDHGSAAELAAKARRAIKALETDNTAMWRALRARGVLPGRGTPGKVAFLYTGQGSQYVNMLKTLREQEPIS